MVAVRTTTPLPSTITATDLFCGGGGGSLGFKLTMWLLFNSTSHGHVDWAINHWLKAVQSHNENFPDTNHDCLDISKANPRRYSRSWVLIAGPSCTDHTTAKGQPILHQNQLRLDLGPEYDTTHDPNAERTRVTMLDIPRLYITWNIPRSYVRVEQSRTSVQGDFHVRTSMGSVSLGGRVATRTSLALGTSAVWSFSQHRGCLRA